MENKDSLVSLIRTICRLSALAWESGVLALEEDWGERGEIDDPLLEYGLSLIVDATWTEDVKRLMEEKAAEFGVDPLHKTLVIEGVLLIQDGEPTEELERKLLLYLEADN